MSGNHQPTNTPSQPKLQPMYTKIFSYLVWDKKKSQHHLSALDRIILSWTWHQVEPKKGISNYIYLLDDKMQTYKGRKPRKMKPYKPTIGISGLIIKKSHSITG